MYSLNATGLLHDKPNDGASAKEGNGARSVLVNTLKSNRPNRTDKPTRYVIPDTF